MAKELENKRPRPETSPAKQETKIQAKAQKEVPLAKPAVAEKKWHETPFVFNYLDAHSDLVSCVDLDDDYVISGRYSLFKLFGRQCNFNVFLLLTVEIP